MSAPGNRARLGQVDSATTTETPADCCDRCDRPVFRDAAGKWQHASLADALFCSLVMRASDRVAARKDDGNA